MSRVKEPPPPYLAPDFDVRDAYAIKALFSGTADADQQTRAVRWILSCASNMDDLSYRPGPDGARDTAFAEGKRFVGIQLYKLAHLSSEYLESRKNADRRSVQSSA